MTTLWYRDGTVAVTAGSKVVTGTDTLWKFAEILDEGDIFTLDGTRLFEVASIDSDTQLTLTEDFVGTTGTGLTYSIIPNYAVRPYAPIIGRQMLLINKWLIREQELTDWQSAPPSSDPANPTKVTITAWNGVKGTYLSLPQLLSMIGAAMDWNLLTNVPANITAWQSINPSTKQDYAPNLTDWSATTVASMAPRAWVDGNYVSLTGDTITGDLILDGGASASITVKDGYLRSYNFGGTSTNGLIVLGDTSSYIAKTGNQYEFNKSAANSQAAWSAYLKQGGDILTTQGNQTVTGPIKFDEEVAVSGKFWAGGEYDYSPGYQVVLADDGSVAYLDAKTRDGAFFTVMNLRGESLKFNGAEVYTTNNFTPGNYLPLVGGTLTGNLTINGGGFTVSNASAIDNSLRLRNWGGVADNGVLYFGTGQSYIFKTGNQFRFANDATTGAFTANLSRSGNILTDQGDQTLTGIFSATWLRAESAPTDTVRAEIRNGNTDIVWIQATNKSTSLPTGQLWYRAISHTWTNEVGNIIASMNNTGVFTGTNVIKTTSFESTSTTATNIFKGNVSVADGLNALGTVYMGGKVNNTANKIRVFHPDATTAVRIDSVTFDAQAFAPMEFRATGFTFHDARASIFNGGFATQQVQLGMGYNNKVTRWTHVLESDGSYAMYAYDTSGGTPTRLLNIRSAVAGGSNDMTVSGKLAIGGASVGSDIYGTVTVLGGIKSLGSGSALVVQQRDNANIEWHMYGTGNQWRVWNSANAQDIMSAGTGGEVRVNNQLYLNAGWFRSQQSGTGWYSEPHGGGIYMQDSNWVRVYNGKGFLVPSNIRIESTSPTIECYDTDEGYTNWLHCNSGNHGFLQHNAYAWGAYRDPNNNWIVVGNIAAYASDARLKKNYRPLADPIGKLAKLDAIEFDWDLEFCEKVGHTPQNPTEHGVLAQQIQKVFPEWVVPAGFNRDYWTVLYDRLSVFNLAVNKAQQKVIEAQEAKIRDQEARLKDMEIRMAKLMARFNKWEAEHG
ncbi:tail fiber domain-containing protein [Stenotrophomonas phage BUCTxx99]|nr:tail fiber domain-containing protein [Stenotrophomonas phage BUCTxx99]